MFERVRAGLISSLRRQEKERKRVCYLLAGKIFYAIIALACFAFV